MSDLLKRLAGEEDGAAMAEYVILASLIAAAMIVTIGSLSGSVSGLIAKASAAFPGAGS